MRLLHTELVIRTTDNRILQPRILCATSCKKMLLVLLDFYLINNNYFYHKGWLELRNRKHDLTESEEAPLIHPSLKPLHWKNRVRASVLQTFFTVFNKFTRKECVERRLRPSDLSGCKSKKSKSRCVKYISKGLRGPNLFVFLGKNCF